ncbi:MAG: transcriptional regulator [Chamaesiphon sp.]|nr:transcriptional regulator [Chamaesiphon sp.]
MTLTFSRDRYRDLLLEYQPKLIKTEVENEQALVIVEKLMHLSNRTPEQQELYELMIVLVGKFEQDFYQRDKPTNPLSMLLFLMEQRDLRSSELVDIFGSQSAVENILNGMIQIDRSSAQLLGQLFHVDPMLFSRS